MNRMMGCWLSNSSSMVFCVLISVYVWPFFVYNRVSYAQGCFFLRRFSVTFWGMSMHARL